jgi:hypothetical protein
LDNWQLIAAQLSFVQAAAKGRFTPFMAELIAKLEVFGSFPGFSLTGEMRTPLDSKQVLLFDLEIWFLLLLLVK